MLLEFSTTFWWFESFLIDSGVRDRTKKLNDPNLKKSTIDQFQSSKLLNSKIQNSRVSQVRTSEIVTLGTYIFINSECIPCLSSLLVCAVALKTSDISNSIMLH